MSDNPVWQNRIVRHGEADPNQLLANEWNWRIHPREQQDALKGALDEIGWIQTVIINLRTSELWGQHRGVETMLDGHARIKLALRHEADVVPVTYVDLTPIEEKKALIILDRITAMAAEDAPMLLDLVQSLAAEGEESVPTITPETVERLVAMSELPSDFPEYDESVADDVEYITCPKCGERWPK